MLSLNESDVKEQEASYQVLSGQTCSSRGGCVVIFSSGGGVERGNEPPDHALWWNLVPKRSPLTAG